MAASQQPVLRFEHPVSIDATSTDPVPEAQDVKAISVDAVLVHYGTNVRRPDDDRSSSTCYPCCHNCQTCNTCRDSSPRGRNSDGCLVCCLGCCDDLCLDCASCFCCGRWYYTADGTVEHSEGYLCQDAGCNCPNPSESMKHPMDFIGCCEWIGKVVCCEGVEAPECSCEAVRGACCAEIEASREENECCCCNCLMCDETTCYNVCSMQDDCSCCGNLAADCAGGARDVACGIVDLFVCLFGKC